MGKLLEKGSKKWIFAAAAGLGVFIGFRYLFPLVTPFLLSFCIVYLCNPWLNRVQRKTHIRKEILLAGVMAGAAAALLVVLWILLQCGLGQVRVLMENGVREWGRVPVSEISKTYRRRGVSPVSSTSAMPLEPRRIYLPIVSFHRSYSAQAGASGRWA